MVYSPESFKDYTILYVEDEKNIRTSVEQCLKYLFNVVSAKDGQEGLEIFQSNKIDIIVTDINMPVKDGMTMIEDIKQLSPSMPFIVTSAYLDNKVKMDSLGVSKYMSKPFDMKDLVMSIIKALKR